MCPFENFSGSDAPQPVLQSGSVSVIPNKFPAFAKGVCRVFSKEGPYTFADGVGIHEVFVLKDHARYIPELSLEEMSDLIRAYRDRYKTVSREECIAYVLIFHNHGREAGASIAHPHSQLVAMPVIPPDVARSVEGSKRYFREHGKCVHCEMVQYELVSKKRLVDENEKFVAFTPFASKIAFETRIFPKVHQSVFEMLEDGDVTLLAEILQRSVARLKKGLNDPAYNFFIHTAPVGDVSRYDHYHWHIEILPKTSVWAGVEIGTGIEISAIMPEEAAEFLRNITV
ncbi:DUF4921 family protein [Candidatus Azambacteria bacterium]|nr:DUF4921 family protein [Candidatus Azambacteria bacterium]